MYSPSWERSAFCKTFGIADEPFGTAEVLLQQVLKRLVTKGGFTWNDYSSERQIESKEKVFLHKQLIVTPAEGENLSRHPSLVMAPNYSANLKIKCNDSWLNRTMEYLQRCNFIFSWCDCRNRRHGKITGLTRITMRLIYTRGTGRSWWSSVSESRSKGMGELWTVPKISEALDMEKARF